jgi:hypothetical protein
MLAAGAAYNLWPGSWQTGEWVAAVRAFEAAAPGWLDSAMFHHKDRGVEEGSGIALTTRFPLPAHQTRRADFPHPAFQLVSRLFQDVAPFRLQFRSLGTLRDWGQARKHPDAPALAYLRVIAKDPAVTAWALAV